MMTLVVYVFFSSLAGCANDEEPMTKQVMTLDIDFELGWELGSEGADWGDREPREITTTSLFHPRCICPQPFHHVNPPWRHEFRIPPEPSSWSTMGGQCDCYRYLPSSSSFATSTRHYFRYCTFRKITPRRKSVGRDSSSGSPQGA